MRRRFVLAGVAVGVVTLLSTVPTWVRATTTTAIETVPVEVTGTAAAPGVGAAGLVVVAAALALALAGTWGRRVAAVVLALAGVLTVVSALGVVATPERVAASAARAAAGVAQVDGAAGLTPAPWAAVVLGVVAVVLGLVTLRVSGRWRSTERRHEQPGDRDDDLSPWDALSRGEDPT